MGRFFLEIDQATDVPLKTELQTFHDGLENPKYETSFLFAATSGLRSGELVELTIDDINEDKRMIVPDKNSSTKQTWVTFHNGEAQQAFERFKPNATQTTSVCSRR